MFRNYNKFLFRVMLVVLLQQSVFLLLGSTASFAQSRFVGITEDVSCTSSECDPAKGYLHLKLGEPELDDPANPTRVTFKVQVRSDLHEVGYQAGVMYIAYSTAAFGRNLAGRCTVDDTGSIFAGTGSLSSSLTNESSDVMKFSATGGADPVTIPKGVEYQTYATLRCNIRNADAEAGLAIDERSRKAHFAWVPGTSATTQTLLTFVDSNLRGYRLDGKTWAEDYSVYDSGKKIRIRFSEPLRTRLEPSHFSFSGDVGISQVTHSAGEAHALVLLDKEDIGILRLASTGTSVVTAGDGNTLAHDSFLAEIRITGRSVSSVIADKGPLDKTGDVTYTLQLNLNPDERIYPKVGETMVSKDDLCITKSPTEGCPMLGESILGEPFIVSEPVLESSTRSSIGTVVDFITTSSQVVIKNLVDASISATVETIRISPPLVKVTRTIPTVIADHFMTVVVNRGTGGKQIENRSIEFRRNAVIVDGNILYPFPDGADDLIDVVEIPDVVGPEITVNASPVTVAPGFYDMVFEVIADEPTDNLNNSNVYELIEILNDGNTQTVVFNIEKIDSINTINNSSATITIFVNDDTTDTTDTIGFVLAYSGEGIADVDGENGPIVRGTYDEASGTAEALGAGELLDGRGSAIALLPNLRNCAAIYPNIGQDKLYIRLISMEANNSGYTIDGYGVREGSISTKKLGEFITIMTVPLDREIEDSSISVQYQETATSDAVEITCEASLSEDYDGDGVIDIVDSNPFDAGVTSPDRSVTSTAPLDPAPAERATYYSRDVVIRSILQGGIFRYRENTTGTLVIDERKAVSVEDYFGINPDLNTRIFRDDADGRCSSLLQTASVHNLNRINAAANCVDVTDYFANEATTGSGEATRRYLWGEVDVNDILTSKVSTYDVRILPQVNFSGQHSYIYAEATDKEVTFSAYVGTADTEDINDVIAVNDNGTLIPRPLLNDGNGLAKDTYDIGTTVNKGEINSYDLVAHTGATNVWDADADGASVVAIVGGNDFGDYQYEIGANDSIDVEFATAEEEVSRIGRTWLLEYTVDELGTYAYERLAISVRPGYSYHLLTEIMTNIADPTITASAEQDAYQIIDGTISSYLLDDFTYVKTDLETLLESDVLFDIISSFDSWAGIFFTVSTSTAPMIGDVITVGWDRIGNLRDIKASYVVADIDADAADSDSDRIPDTVESVIGYDSINDRLAVNTSLTATSPTAINYIRTEDFLPLYVSDQGLILAVSNGGDEIADYSPANIQYGELTDSTKEALGYRESGSAIDRIPIETIATYGVRDIIHSIGTDGLIAGGISYTILPVETALVDQALYLAKYNEATDLWEDMGLVSEGNTWYAIPRPSTEDPCPSDIEIYKNLHRRDGIGGLGFKASEHNCIMVVTTDGSPYDSGGVDGRISESIAIGNQLISLTSGRIECASFYPHIGQRELFLRLTSSFPIRTPIRLTLSRNGSPLPASVEQVGETDENSVSILKATLENEITSLADITARYRVTSGDTGIEATCVASLTANSDGDTLADTGNPLPDVADANPFDANERGVNPIVASVEPLKETPTQQAGGSWYSREVVIRSLLRGEEFSYIAVENNVPIKRTFSEEENLTLFEYFGVGRTARIHRVDPGSACQQVVNAVIATNRLNRVKINEFCTDVTDNFIDEAIGDNREYMWAEVSGGILASVPEKYTVSILPEINFDESQDSFEFLEATTKTVSVAAELIDARDNPLIFVNRLSDDRNRQFEYDELYLTSDGTNASGSYRLSDDERHPNPGETITHWLDEATLSGAAKLWLPKEDNLKPREGGHTFAADNLEYAIGPDSHLAVKLAEMVEEEAEQIRMIEIQLYEVDDSPHVHAQRVTSVEPGLSYYVVAVFASMRGEDPETLELLIPGPNYRAMPADRRNSDLESIVRTLALERNEGANIALSAIDISDDATVGETVEVGWTSIGDLQSGGVGDVIATYQVTDRLHEFVAEIPTIAQPADIPDDVNVQEGTNVLRVLSLSQEQDRTISKSDIGMIIAREVEGDGFMTRYNELSDDSKAQLDGLLKIDDGTLSIDKIITTDTVEIITTFEVRNVPYEISADDSNAGGEAAVSFPVHLAAVDKDDKVYLSKFDRTTDAWQRFTRENAGHGTWYAKERTKDNDENYEACPNTPSRYRLDMTLMHGDNYFTASDEQNYCIMLILTDGGLYDSSGTDGRIVDPLIFSFEGAGGSTDGSSDDTGISTGGGGGGGGGATEAVDIILLIGTLLLLLTVARRNVRADSHIRP